MLPATLPFLGLAMRCLVLFLATVSATPLDDYVNKADDNYKWSDTNQSFKTVTGGTAHLINVTSQKWLDESRAYGPNGAIWTHQVLVIVPKELKIRDRAMIYITGNCNENPSIPKATDEEPLVVDVISHDVGCVGVILYQIPNCHIIYPSDPEKKARSEDAMIAWAWNEFLKTQDPEWLPRLPMVKASMRAMQAVQEYTKQEGVADIDGWVVAGASKRGWTTWMVGAVDCPTCPKIVGLGPIVPIVPDIQADMHHMWKSYGGFTFAFTDYTDVNLTTHLDGPGFVDMLKVVDPINEPYLSRLAKIPKHIIVSSDDEFMMFEQTNLWWDKMGGEKFLTIAQNSEHSMATGVVELLETLQTFCSSLFNNGTRPTWSFDVDQDNGVITVRIPPTQPHGKVVMRHAHTISTKRRDFRWVRLANEENGECKLPEVTLKKPVFGGNCIAPIVWEGTDLNETSPGVWTATVPKPLIGWKGMYVEAYFPSDTGMKTDYQFTTPGIVWPNTYIADDCTLDNCTGRLV